MNYETIIGLEVHVELNTASKMFCGCSADYFGKEPNSLTCPVCLGLPGGIPYINQAAIDKCIRIGLALGCRINTKSRFERKNYFYPDLAKGFQISQLRWPLAVEGKVVVENKDGEKIEIRINRAHQEEDTAKLTHQLGISNYQFPTSNEKNNATVSFVDFNRSGVPLVEIVTEPDFRDSEAVRNYAKFLQQVFRDLGVSNADMERGDMRLEANISVRPVGQTELPNYRVELKNINSFRFMKAAIDFEVKRQIEALERGEKLRQETRGWNETRQETYVQRSKEEANDYRYFPEPDLPEMVIDEAKIAELRQTIPVLTWEKVEKLVAEGVDQRAAIVTLERLGEKGWTLEGIIDTDPTVSVKEVVNLVANLPSLSGLADEAEVCREIRLKKEKTNDEGQLGEWVKMVIEENPTGAVEAYRSGKEAALGVLVGAVMKKASGRADAGRVRELLMEKLK